MGYADARDRGSNIPRMGNLMDDEVGRQRRLFEILSPTLGGGLRGFHDPWERLTRDQQREVVFLRDAYCCALSGADSDLLLHHLYPNRDESRGMASLIVLNRWWHTDHHERLRAGDADAADIAAELRAIADARSRDVVRVLTEIWGEQ